MPLRWTTEKPLSSGWYWYKDGTASVVVSVEIGTFDSFHIEWVWFTGARTQVPLASLRGEWAGPLDPPQEPGGPA